MNPSRRSQLREVLRARRRPRLGALVDRHGTPLLVLRPRLGRPTVPSC